MTVRDNEVSSPGVIVTPIATTLLTVLERAGHRCECTDSGCHGAAERCERRPPSVLLIVAPADPTCPPARISRLPAGEMRAWCPQCWDLAARAARAQRAAAGWQRLPISPVTRDQQTSEIERLRAEIVRLQDQMDLRGSGAADLYRQAQELIILTATQRSALTDARELAEHLRDELTQAHQALYWAEAELISTTPLQAGHRWRVIPPTESPSGAWRVYLGDQLHVQLAPEAGLDEILVHVDRMAGHPLTWRRGADATWNGA